MKLSLEIPHSLGFRKWLMLTLVDIFGPVYARIFKRSKKKWSQTKETLTQFERGSFGWELGQFLTENQIELMPYLESHDVYHLLGDFPTTVEGEGKLIFFIFGNGKRSLFTLGSVLLAWVLMPEWWEMYLASYERGKKAKPFVCEDFEHWLAIPYSKIKEDIFGK